MDIAFYQLSQKYFQGTISDDEEKLLAEFMQGSEQNRAQFRQWEEEWRNCAQQQAPDKTKAAWERMTAQMQPAEKAHTGTVHRRRWFLYAAAAAVVLAVLGCALWWLIPRSPQEPFMAQTAPHQQQTVTLPDGTQVTLNASSKLVCSEQFGQNDRHITFEGEAEFDVKKNAALPFVIQVGDYSVTVLGTHFNLSAYQQDEAYTLALIEGSVKVKYKQDSVMVQPNEQVRFDRKTATFTKAPVQAVQSVGWTQGKLTFDNIPLQDLASKLERLYDVRISFADSQLAQEQVYISITVDQPFADVCAALEALLPITIQEQNGTYLISAQ